MAAAVCVLPGRAGRAIGVNDVGDVIGETGIGTTRRATICGMESPPGQQVARRPAQSALTSPTGSPLIVGLSAGLLAMTIT
jgi:hypothetical protein